MSDKIKILLAEDEEVLAEIVKESLETRDFNVVLCANGEEVLKAYAEYQPELLVLDVMMPLKDGFTVAKEIRNLDEKIPIIFLTAKSQTQDVVAGFSIGGNDYLKKPFSMEELIVRIHNLLNYTKKAMLEEVHEGIAIGTYTFDVAKQELRYGGEDKVVLTHKETQLLFHLVSHKNELLERSYILNELWGADDFFTARSMDVYITKLRKRLKQDGKIKILNVRGLGYKLIC
ncbi:DNA-binding response regulator [Neptunitalea chrysea]|uniref:DNA-binding response regulator n=1 Tax=Neptunitalea chrysea TaxID=1647581 RepID=A0A9W6B2Z5_9FLAO|nr:response regulator transcription factor [Neptunitalea chrysea]GLB51399.1 DNA-binding response regulator [Neptunitalea chrysea]